MALVNEPFAFSHYVFLQLLVFVHFWFFLVERALVLHLQIGKKRSYNFVLNVLEFKFSCLAIGTNSWLPFSNVCLLFDSFLAVLAKDLIAARALFQVDWNLLAYDALEIIRKMTCKLCKCRDRFLDAMLALHTLSAMIFVRFYLLVNMEIGLVRIVDKLLKQHPLQMLFRDDEVHAFVARQEWA